MRLILLKTDQNVASENLTMLNKQKNKKIFVIAGEVSGDVLGAKIMAQMPQIDFVGIGGENMAANGLKSLFPISDLAVMGLVEVVANIRTLSTRINETVAAIIKEKPIIVLSIDSPSFAKQVIKKLKNGGHKLPKFYHVVAPQVWAWRENRAEKFAKTFDKLYAFFDFEIPYFTKHGLDTIAVGHPIAEGLIDYKSSKKTIKTNKKTIALMPGSRMSEVKKLLPIFEQVVNKLDKNKYDFVIPVVETTKSYIESELKMWDNSPALISAKKRYDLYSKTYIAIAASGTVSAELAMMHIPTIVVYKMNKVTTFLLKKLIKVKWASLVNILMNRCIYPELLGENATAENIISEFKRLMKTDVRKKMISDLSDADKIWVKGKIPASKQIALDILKDIKKL